MPADAPRQQLATIAAVTDDLDQILDKLFANVAELKVILARTGTDGGGGAGEDDPRPGA